MSAWDSELVSRRRVAAKRRQGWSWTICQAVSVACAAMTLAACGDPVGRAWLVERPRVLGARVSAAGDPERSSLVPGERGRLEWLVADTDGAARVAYSFATCARPEGNWASPRCEAVMAAGAGASDNGGAAAFDVEAPAGFEGDMMTLVAFCTQGEPALDARAFSGSCAGGGEPLLASAIITVSRAAANRNPVLRSDSILLDGAAMTEPCLPVLPGDHTLAVRLSGDEREAGTHGAETLLLSHVVTAGTLDRQYSVLEPGEAMPREFAVAWSLAALTAPAHVFVVLRDGRGGTAFARRTVCAAANP